MSDYLIAVIVGCVEGLTEFIPVSSTAHMIIVGHLLGFKGDFAALFDVFIQLGAILSIIFIYKERFRRFFTKDGWNRERGLSVWHIAAGMLPICIVGYLAHDFIKGHLFSPLTAAAGLIVGALLMMYAEKRQGGKNDQLVQDIDKMSMKQCFTVGLYQILACWPGFSRSGSTIAGGMLAGVSRNVAAEYTFLMAVPLMFLACIFIAPIAAIIPAAATSSALIYVGILMLAGLKNINFDDIAQTVPVALMLIAMPLSGSIGHAIGLGLISYTIIRIFTGKAKEVSVLTYVISALFLLKFFVVA